MPKDKKIKDQGFRPNINNITTAFSCLSIDDQGTNQALKIQKLDVFISEMQQISYTHTYGITHKNISSTVFNILRYLDSFDGPKRELELKNYIICKLIDNHLITPLKSMVAYQPAVVRDLLRNKYYDNHTIISFIAACGNPEQFQDIINIAYLDNRVSKTDLPKFYVEALYASPRNIIYTVIERGKTKNLVVILTTISKISNEFNVIYFLRNNNPNQCALSLALKLPKNRDNDHIRNVLCLFLTQHFIFPKDKDLNTSTKIIEYAKQNYFKLDLIKQNWQKNQKKPFNEIKSVRLSKAFSCKPPTNPQTSPPPYQLNNSTPPPYGAQGNQGNHPNNIYSASLVQSFASNSSRSLNANAKPYYPKDASTTKAAHPPRQLYAKDY